MENVNVEARPSAPTDPAMIYAVGANNSDANPNLIQVKSTNTYFRQRNHSIHHHLYLGLIAACATFFFGFMVLSILYGIIRPAPLLCTSEECMRTAASLKESMDLSVDPCHDFYQYTCGKWSHHHLIRENKLEANWFGERYLLMMRRINNLLNKERNQSAPWAVRQAKKLFDSCNDIGAMDDSGLVPLRKLLDRLGLPQVPPSLTNRTGNFVKQLASMKKILDKEVLFGFRTIINPINNSRNLIVLHAPSRKNPLPRHHEIEKRMQMIRKYLTMDKSELTNNTDVPKSAFNAERHYVRSALKEVLSNGSYDTCEAWNACSNISNHDLERTVRMILNFSETLRSMSVSGKKGSSLFVSVDELQNLTNKYATRRNAKVKPKTFWRPYFEEIFKNERVDLEDDELMIVEDLTYMNHIANVIANTDDQVLETYIWWKVVTTVASHSSRRLREIWSSYVYELSGIQWDEPRELSCSHAVNELMGMAVTWMYVDKNATTVQKVTEMLSGIKKTFAEMIGELDWLDEKTRNVTLEKNKNMLLAVSNPAWLYNANELNELYKGANITNSSFLGNMVSLIELANANEIIAFTRTNVRNATNPEWPGVPTEVNAFYYMLLNQIIVPVGILQFPFYGLGLEAMDYGAIGAVLGHELTHGFDNRGRSFDKFGNLRETWSNTSIAAYKNRTKCYVEQYSRCYEKSVKKHVNGKNTLGENIADNGGLKEAFRAYRKWASDSKSKLPHLPGFENYTHEQLFYLSFAHLWCGTYTPQAMTWALRDVHSPNHVRVREVLKNSEHFGEVWQCPVGTNMNPKEKCTLW